MVTDSNYRPGAATGLALLFAFGYPWPGTTQRGCYLDIDGAIGLRCAWPKGC